MEKLWKAFLETSGKPMEKLLKSSGNDFVLVLHIKESGEPEMHALENLWKTSGKALEKLWKTSGKVLESLLGNLWKSSGKPLENLWEKGGQCKGASRPTCWGVWSGGSTPGGAWYIQSMVLMRFLDARAGIQNPISACPGDGTVCSL